MIKKTLLLLTIIIHPLTHQAFSQSIMNAQLNVTPLAINPAFTGMFDGGVRASSLYSNYWASVTVPYVSTGASVDMPVFTDSKGNYLAAGLLFHNDRAGDGNISDFNAGLSLAYHKLFGKLRRNYDLAIGLQGCYIQNSTDLSPLYFGSSLPYANFISGTGQYHLGLGNSINYYAINTGFSLSHGDGKFSYTLGAAVNNFNAPNQSIEKEASGTDMLDMNYTAEALVNWAVTKRLTLSPEIFYQNQSGNNYFIAGNEFHYNTSRSPGHPSPTSIFIGGWYQTGQTATVTAGIELRGFRLGLSYGYDISTLNTASNGQGEFAISLKYIAPGHRSSARYRITSGSSF